MKPSARRHVLYFLLMPCSVIGGSDLNEHAQSIQDYAIWISVVFLGAIAWYSRKQAIRADADHDAITTLTAVIKNMDGNFTKMSSSVERIADNQSMITTRQGEQEAAARAFEKYQTDKWLQQEKLCNEHRELCGLCDRRRKP